MLVPIDSTTHIGIRSVLSLQEGVENGPDLLRGRLEKKLKPSPRRDQPRAAIAIAIAIAIVAIAIVVMRGPGPGGGREERVD